MEIRMKSLFAALSCAVAVAAFGATGAMAGEVKGPPGTIQNTNFTPVHFGVAASVCSFNGLNDFTQGQTDFQVQNFGVGVAGLTPSEPQDPHVFNPGSPVGGCRGS
jgi:hypothetical protein